MTGLSKERSRPLTSRKCRVKMVEFGCCRQRRMRMTEAPLYSVRNSKGRKMERVRGGCRWMGKIW